MNTSTIDDTHPDNVIEGVRILREGGVIAIPTDTLYGLAASVFIESAVERVFEIKGRPANLAMPVLVADVSHIEECCSDVPEIAWSLAKCFWPGALTLVLKKSERIPDVVTGGRNTVAVRLPNHPVPVQIAAGLGAPITGTSANRSGGRNLTDAKSVEIELGGVVDLVIEGGKSSEGVGSTILDLSDEQPRILRQGAVSTSEIEEFLGFRLLS